MARSPDAIRVERLNAALGLLDEQRTLADAAAMLVATYGMSKRQAYRYLNEARKRPHPVPVPPRKIAFTVKLSEGLVLQLRQRARSSGQTLSELVSQALDAFLRKGREGGQK